MISGQIFFSKRLLALAVLTTAVTGSAWGQTPSANPPAAVPGTMPAATRPSFPPLTAVINGENLTRDDYQVALEMIAGPRF